jgi:hypothetical protein
MDIIVLLFFFGSGAYNSINNSPYASSIPKGWQDYRKQPKAPSNPEGMTYFQV